MHAVRAERFGNENESRIRPIFLWTLARYALNSNLKNHPDDPSAGQDEKALSNDILMLTPLITR
jgi:hypothetical protein